MARSEPGEDGLSILQLPVEIGGDSGENTPSDLARLRQHLDAALGLFAENGLTPRQQKRLETNPELKAAFRGERIHTHFADCVGRDKSLRHLRLIPRFVYGPDVFDPVKGVWYDVTTPKDWPTHVNKYQNKFGTGTSLFYDKQ
jgi:hypothetical protein